MTAKEAIEAIQVKGLEIEGKARRMQEFLEGLVMAEEALEKQIPKKPHRNYENLNWKWCSCGWCLKVYEEGKNFCPNCGQKLDWGE